jgi:RNA polymerase sigma-70 factor (ECF subfamily)
MEFRREYLVRLPLPLAQLYSRAFNAKDARSRHDNTFYLFEALTKLAATPAIACYAHEVRTGRQPHVPKLDRLLQDLALPSFGQWVGIVRELCRHFGQRPDAAGHPLGHLARQLDQKRTDQTALLHLYRRIKGGVDNPPAKDTTCSILEVLDSLVQYRNLVFGHGGPRFDSFFEKDMGPLLFPAVNALLEQGVWDFLGPRGSRLVYLTELRTLDAEHAEVGLRELIGLEGERLAPLVLSRSEAESLLPNRVAMLWPDRPVPLPLDPLLAYRESETAVEMLFLNRDRNERQVEYLSYTTGRTERDPNMAVELRRLLSLFVGQQVTDEGLQRLADQSILGTPRVESSAPEGAPVLPPAMKTTSVSLLRRLQAPGPHESDWQRFQDIYLPLIRHWLGRVPGLAEETADLSQEVLIVVLREIPRFERQREGSFRTWLRQVTVNKLRTYWKQRGRRPSVGIEAADRFLDQLIDPKGDLAREWDRDHDRHVFRKLLEIVRGDFNPATLEVFQRFAVDGIPAAKVAAEVGMGVNAVLHAKARVLKRLREEAGELLD